MKPVTKKALINALSAVAYVVAVATTMFNAQKVFGPVNTVLVPIAMLLLLVFSVALMGYLIFGKPILLYLDGKKQEALSLLSLTLAIFSVVTIFAFFTLILLTR